MPSGRKKYPPGQRKKSTSVNLKPDLVERSRKAVEKGAAKNFSQLVAIALSAYLYSLNQEGD